MRHQFWHTENFADELSARIGRSATSCKKIRQDEGRTSLDARKPVSDKRSTRWDTRLCLADVETQARRKVDNAEVAPSSSSSVRHGRSAMLIRVCIEARALAPPFPKRRPKGRRVMLRRCADRPYSVLRSRTASGCSMLPLPSMILDSLSSSTRAAGLSPAWMYIFASDRRSDVVSGAISRAFFWMSIA